MHTKNSQIINVYEDDPEKEKFKELFNKLPKELYDKIFSFLTFVGVFKMRGVSTGFDKLIFNHFSIKNVASAFNKKHFAITSKKPNEQFTKYVSEFTPLMKKLENVITTTTTTRHITIKDFEELQKTLINEPKRIRKFLKKIAPNNSYVDVLIFRMEQSIEDFIFESNAILREEYRNKLEKAKYRADCTFICVIAVLFVIGIFLICCGFLPTGLYLIWSIYCTSYYKAAQGKAILEPLSLCFDNFTIIPDTKFAYHNEDAFNNLATKLSNALIIYFVAAIVLVCCPPISCGLRCLIKKCFPRNRYNYNCCYSTVGRFDNKVITERKRQEEKNLRELMNFLFERFNE